MYASVIFVVSVSFHKYCVCLSLCLHVCCFLKISVCYCGVCLYSIIHVCIVGLLVFISVSSDIVLFSYIRYVVSVVFVVSVYFL